MTEENVSDFAGLIEEGVIINNGPDEEGLEMMVFGGWSCFRKLLYSIIAWLQEDGLTVRCDNTRDTADSFYVSMSDDLKQTLVESVTSYFGVKSSEMPVDLFEDYDESTGEVLLTLDQLVGGIVCGRSGYDRSEWYGFADEYDSCSECGKIVHIAPNSYFDIGRFAWIYDEVTCRECLERDPSSYLDYVLEKQSSDREPVPYMLDPSAVGYVKLAHPKHGEDVVRFQCGMHPGMNDDPKKQLAALRKAGVENVLFQMSPSQFYFEWDVWVDPSEEVDVTRVVKGWDEEEDEWVNGAATIVAEHVLSTCNAKCDVEPSEVAKKQLMAVAKLPPPSGDVIRYVEGQPDGSIIARDIPREQFIKYGTKLPEEG